MIETPVSINVRAAATIGFRGGVWEGAYGARSARGRQPARGGGGEQGGEGVCQAGGQVYKNATSKPAPTNRAMAPAMYATMDVPASRPDGPPRPWR